MKSSVCLRVVDFDDSHRLNERLMIRHALSSQMDALVHSQPHGNASKFGAEPSSLAPCKTIHLEHVRDTRRRGWGILTIKPQKFNRKIHRYPCEYVDLLVFDCGDRSVEVGVHLYIEKMLPYRKTSN